MLSLVRVACTTMLTPPVSCVDNGCAKVLGAQGRKRRGRSRGQYAPMTAGGRGRIRRGSVCLSNGTQMSCDKIRAAGRIPLAPAYAGH